MKLNNIAKLIMLSLVVAGAAQAMDNNKKRKRNDSLHPVENTKKVKITSLQEFFLDAILKEDIDTVRNLAKRYPEEINRRIYEQQPYSNEYQIIPDEPGFDTLLHVATRTGNLEILKILLAHGGDINVKSVWDANLFLTAYQERHMHIVDYLFPFFKDKDNADEGGHTLLMEAVKDGDMKRVEWLLPYDYIDCIDAQNNDALVYAYENNYPEIFMYLIDTGNASTENFEEYLGWGDDDDRMQSEKEKINDFLFDAVEKGSLKTIQLFDRLGVDFNLVDNESKESLFTKVLKCKKVEIVKWLLGQKKVIIDQSIIIGSVRYGNLDIVKLLFESNNDLFFNTCMPINVLSREDVNQLNNTVTSFSRRPLSLGIRNTHPALILTPLNSSSDINVLRFLLDNGVPVTKYDYRKCIAAIKGHLLDVVYMFLKKNRSLKFYNITFSQELNEYTRLVKKMYDFRCKMQPDINRIDNKIKHIQELQKFNKDKKDNKYMHMLQNDLSEWQGKKLFLENSFDDYVYKLWLKGAQSEDQVTRDACMQGLFALNHFKQKAVIRISNYLNKNDKRRVE